MTHDEVIARFVADRAVFDAKVGAIPPEHLSEIPPGHDYSPRDIVFHVSAYEELIAELIALDGFDHYRMHYTTLEAAATG